MLSLRLRRWLTIGLSVLLVAPGPALSGNPEAAHPTRIVSGIPNADRLLEDLAWIVGTLADEQQTWDETLLPAAEVFLIGVDRSRPVGTDIVFNEEGQQRQQFQIPLENLKEFREENLEPIDIQSKKKAADYYQLDSEALGYEGWMRIVDNYASISQVESDVPAGMPSPKAALDDVLSKSGYDAGLKARNSSDGLADRRIAFGKRRERLLQEVARRPTESPADFELRKRLTEHRIERAEALFVEAEELVAGWITDSEQQEAHGELTLTGLAGTELAQVIAKFGAAPSHFAAVPTTDDALIHGRMNIPIDQRLQTQADEFYELVAPVWKQRIDGDKDLSPEQKRARNQICDLGLAMLHDGRELESLDACIEATPVAGGTAILLAGIRALDGTKAVEIVKLIPDALGGLSLELNFDTAGEYALHRLKATGKVPAALEAFYGMDQPVYVATHKDAVWIAAGVGSLDKLKATIALVAESQPEPNGDVFVGLVRLGPVIKHLDDLAVELGFDPQRFLGRAPADDADSDSETKNRKPADALKNLDLRKIALPVLRESEEDHFSIQVRQAEGKIHADMTIERGVLKAAGKVIAKVAAERLAG